GMRTFVVSGAPFHFPHHFPQLGLLNGLDLVHGQINSIIVGVVSQRDAKGIGLCIAAKGSQCVLLRTDVFNVLNGQMSRATTLLEVGWFSAANLPSHEVVSEWIDELVAVLIMKVDRSVR